MENKYLIIINNLSKNVTIEFFPDITGYNDIEHYLIENRGLKLKYITWSTVDTISINLLNIK